jgi:Na+/proline symporter
MACVPTTGTGPELSRRCCLWVSSWCGITTQSPSQCFEYLRLRCNYRAHLLNSISFAVVTVLMSGINMFAFAVVFNSMLAWPFTPSVLLSAGVALIYTFWGGLPSSIYDEVLQFFLISGGIFVALVYRAA